MIEAPHYTKQSPKPSFRWHHYLGPCLPTALWSLPITQRVEPLNCMDNWGAVLDTHSCARSLFCWCSVCFFLGLCVGSCGVSPYIHIDMYYTTRAPMVLSVCKVYIIIGLVGAFSKGDPSNPKDPNRPKWAPIAPYRRLEGL